jgi:hypothetical protein
MNPFSSFSKTGEAFFFYNEWVLFWQEKEIE